MSFFKTYIVELPSLNIKDIDIEYEDKHEVKMHAATNQVEFKGERLPFE
jgi:hypothetical protein